MKYLIELWQNMELTKKLETNDFEQAKQQWVVWHKENDENMLGSTDFKIDGISMTFEWKYEHLLGLDFNKLLKESKVEI